MVECLERRTRGRWQHRDRSSYGRELLLPLRLLYALSSADTRATLSRSFNGTWSAWLGSLSKPYQVVDHVTEREAWLTVARAGRWIRWSCESKTEQSHGLPLDCMAAGRIAAAYVRALDAYSPGSEWSERLLVMSDEALSGRAIPIEATRRLLFENYRDETSLRILREHGWC